MIEFTHAEVPVGGLVSGRLVARRDEGAASRASVAWLVWRMEHVGFLAGDGRTFEDCVVVARQPLDRAPGANAFEFRIPDQGPVSYDGKLFRLVWEVVVGGQSPAPEPVACAAFRVVPRPAPAG
jgi:hypothetical protein